MEGKLEDLEEVFAHFEKVNGYCENLCRRLRNITELIGVCKA